MPDRTTYEILQRAGRKQDGEFTGKGAMCTRADAELAVVSYGAPLWTACQFAWTAGNAHTRGMSRWPRHG